MTRLKDLEISSWFRCVREEKESALELLKSLGLETNLACQDFKILDAVLSHISSAGISLVETSMAKQPLERQSESPRYSPTLHGRKPGHITD